MKTLLGTSLFAFCTTSLPVYSFPTRTKWRSLHNDQALLLASRLGKKLSQFYESPRPALEESISPVQRVPLELKRPYCKAHPS